MCDAIWSVAWLINRSADSHPGPPYFDAYFEKRIGDVIFVCSIFDSFFLQIYRLLAYSDIVGSILSLLRSNSIPLLNSALKLVTNLSEGTKEQITTVFQPAVFRDLVSEFFFDL